MKRLMALILALAALWGLALGETPQPPVTREGRPEDTEPQGARYGYELREAVLVDGRQGVAWGEEGVWVSGSATLARYTPSWELAARNDEPFAAMGSGVNHIGDIDVWRGELYAGVERFADGEASDIRIAVYDAMTLEYLRDFPFAPESGQTECSGIAVDPERGVIWMCSWADGESGRYLYRYDLRTGAYLGRVHLQPPPQWIQGVACYEGGLFLTADDGTADDGEPDHLYRVDLLPGGTAARVALERTFDDVRLMGEIEGLTFDRERGRVLVLFNRGARIVLGMPRGFYAGYTDEIHEVYAFEMAQ